MLAYDAQTLVLCVLARGPAHGYAINSAIEGIVGERLGPSSLYGALTRLEAKALIEPVDGVGRQRPVRITDRGREVLTRELEAMARVTRAGLSNLGATTNLGAPANLGVGRA